MIQRPCPHRKIIFFVTEDWYFVSHRLPLAIAAREAGYQVSVVTRVRKHGDVIRRAGLGLVPFENSRASVNPIRELSTVIRLFKLCKRERPTIIHNIAFKPVVLGTIAARLAAVENVVNTFAGLGYVFTSTEAKISLLRRLFRYFIRFLFLGERTRVIVQNQSDRDVLEKFGVSSEKIVLIESSGVDLAQFVPQSEPSGPVVVAMVSRMLWSKGVGELVEAARFLRESGQNVRICLIGAPDPDNPSSIEEEVLRGWSRSGIVEWMGPVPNDEIAGIWKSAHIGVLPSYYGEGVPKSLLEAAASGKPLVVTDMPGCREVVVHEETGLLVQPRDSKALANAIVRLAEDPLLRMRLGLAARARVEQRFSLARVINQTLRLYRSLAPTT